MNKAKEENREQSEILEEATEQVKDAINILQLLSIGIEDNGGDEHAQRSVGIAEKILQSVIKNLQQLEIH